MSNAGDQCLILQQRESSLVASKCQEEELAALRKKLADAEAEQNSLCENERYEEADALDTTIQELKATITLRLEEVSSESKKADELARTILGMAKDREAIAKDVLEKVDALHKGGESNHQEINESDERRISAEDTRLDSERKRMDLARQHNEKDSANIEDESKQLTQAIDEATIDHVKARDEAEEKRSALDAEIAELEAALKMKMEERKSLQEVVDTCEVKVVQIRGKFDKQITRVQTKQRRLEENQREVEQDQLQVEQMAEELERDRQACAEQSTARRKRIAEVRREARSLRKLGRFLVHVVEVRARWQQLLEPHQEKLNEARKHWEDSTKESAKLADSAAALETEAGKQRAQIDAIMVQLPQLEAEKKAAVSSRSFKEAGRLAEEIKRRDESRGGLEKELDGIQASLGGMREQLAASRSTEETAQAALLEAESTCAVETLRVMRKQVRDLKKLSRTGTAIAIDESDRNVLERELVVVERCQEHLTQKCGVDLKTLEELASEDEPSYDPEEESAGEEEEKAQEPSRPQSPAAASGAVEEAPAAAAVEAAAAGGEVAAALIAEAVAETEVEAAPPAKDPEELKARKVELEEGIAENQAREASMDALIEEAVAADDFDKAAELEDERKVAEDWLVEAKKELAEIVEALSTFVVEEEATPEEEAAEPAPAGEESPEAQPVDVAIVDEGAAAVEDADAAEAANTELGDGVSTAAPAEMDGEASPEATSAGDADASPTAASGFGFLDQASPSVSDGAASPMAEAPQSSGFSFVASSEPASPQADANEGAGGFAFVAGGSVTAPEEEQAEAPADAPQAPGFAFVGGSSAAEENSVVEPAGEAGEEEGEADASAGGTPNGVAATEA